MIASLADHHVVTFSPGPRKFLFLFLIVRSGPGTVSPLMVDTSVSEQRMNDAHSSAQLFVSYSLVIIGRMCASLIHSLSVEVYLAGP